MKARKLVQSVALAAASISAALASTSAIAQDACPDEPADFSDYPWPPPNDPPDPGDGWSGPFEEGNWPPGSSQASGIQTKETQGKANPSSAPGASEASKKVDKALNVLFRVRPEAAAAIKGMTDDGTMCIEELAPRQGVNGWTEGTSIGLKLNRSTLQIAGTLLHEFEHVQDNLGNTYGTLGDGDFLFEPPGGWGSALSHARVYQAQLEFYFDIAGECIVLCSDLTKALQAADDAWGNAGVNISNRPDVQEVPCLN